MEDILTKLPGYLESISLYLSIITVIATALVRIPALSKYEKDVSGFLGFIKKMLSWMPTLGVNPRTKDLEKKATGS